MFNSRNYGLIVSECFMSPVADLESIDGELPNLFFIFNLLVDGVQFQDLKQSLGQTSSRTYSDKIAGLATPHILELSTTRNPDYNLAYYMIRTYGYMFPGRYKQSIERLTTLEIPDRMPQGGLRILGNRRQIYIDDLIEFADEHTPDEGFYIVHSYHNPVNLFNGTPTNSA